MAYETKAILIAIASLIRNTRDLKKVYETVEKMANAEGVILEALDDKAELDEVR